MRSKAFSKGVEVTGPGLGGVINIQAADNSIGSAPLLVAPTPVGGDQPASSTGTALPAEVAAPPTPAATPLSPGQVGTNAASAPSTAPSNAPNAGIGTVVPAGIIGGVAVVGVAVFGVVAFLRGRRSRQTQGRAIPLPPRQIHQE